MKRGGQPEREMAHAHLLLDAGAEAVWGWGTPAGQERVRARVRWFIDTCNLRPGVNALECGCGTGVFTRHLANTGATILAVDISDRLLAEARKLCPDPNVTFSQADLEDPAGLVDADFDVVLGVSVLHHLDMGKALAALCKKLKPGGRFAFSEPNLLNPINRYVLFTDDQEKRRKHGVSPSEVAFRPDELRAAFESAGFVVEQLKHKDFLHPSTPRVLIPAMKLAGFLAEHLPVAKSLSGSLWISGRRNVL